MEDFIDGINEKGSWEHPAEAIEPEAESEFLILADGLGRLVEWVCRSGKPVVVGHRALVVAYILRPEMLAVKSEADLARGLGISRQAISKILNEFRDTFGVGTSVMRKQETREKCRQARQN